MAVEYETKRKTKDELQVSLKEKEKKNWLKRKKAQKWEKPAKEGIDSLVPSPKELFLFPKITETNFYTDILNLITKLKNLEH